MRILVLIAVLLSPSAASAGPRLELDPALRAFIDLAMVEAQTPRLELRTRPRPPKPPAILGGPTPADPLDDPGRQALNAVEYGLALVIGLGTSAGDSWQDQSAGELPGLLRSADRRGGYPFWSTKQTPEL